MVEYAATSRRAGCLLGVADLLVLNHDREMDTRVVAGAGPVVLTSTADRHQSMIDVRP